MPVTPKSTLQVFWQDRRVDAHFRAGVSLHSHTVHSEESLDIIPRYVARVPFLCSAIRCHEAEYMRRTGTRLDFGQAFWTPPLTPRQAYRLEEKQINRQLQLPGLISLTDHDDIRAGSLLRVMNRFHKTPVSTEWTVPFAPTFFHLGLHNLPVIEAPQLMRNLAEFTGDPDPNKLPRLLAALNAYPDLLVVLNHPFWDEKGIGAENHVLALRQLLERNAGCFHALELNGLRSWHENKKVISLAHQLGLPVVSGGDRHGREPNAILNLTRGSTLVEFIHEVRYEGISHVVLMPQYNEPLKLRILRTVMDSLRYYPENPEGRKSWSDRVFYRAPASGPALPLSAVWNHGGPKIVRNAIAVIPLLEWRGIQSALKIVLNDRSYLWSGDEAGAALLLSSLLHEWGGAGWKKD